MREGDPNQADPAARPSPPPPGEPPAELPDELADRAAEQLLAVDRSQRAAVLETLLAAHPEHAAGLRRLQADLGCAERLLAGSWPGDAAEVGSHLGGHRVLRRLGEGSFGIVFLCAQDRPVVRQVAVKVLRPGAGDQYTLRRFEAERQLLASLNHPAITQVFDAGELPDGRPYFVMEYVDGAPMRRYCEERGLSCRDRLRLFVELGRGVAHAHKRGIVHRDLKPANVLIVDTDNGPLPKIIDFGIAKALVTAHDGDVHRTDTGRVLGTPGYMSPEQAAGRIGEVDERTDVFALGVMLYELLTGELPWARGAGTTDTEPVRPSARVTTATRSSPTSPLAGRRQLAAELRGDLDWITLKALARERSERYAKVTALIDDVERHLRGQPVSVGPPSTAYRLRKFVRRNRQLVAACGGALVILAAGLAFALAYGSAAAAEVTDARRAAAASFTDATAIVDQLLARANDPRLRDAPQGDAAREALLQDVLSFYAHFQKERPTDLKLRAGRCRALLSIADVHLQLGEPTRAGSTATEAEAEATALLAAEPSDLSYRALLGESLRRQGSAFTLAANQAAAHPKFVAAVEQLAPCATAAPAVHGRSHVAALRAVALTLDPAQLEQRIAGLRECLRALEALRTAAPGIAGLAKEFVATVCGLASALDEAHGFEEAYAILGRAEQALPEVTTERLAHTFEVRSMQGRIAWADRDRPGRRRAALEHAQAAVETAIAWQSEQPRRLLPQSKLTRALRELGYMQNYEGDFAGSQASYRRAIAQAEATVRQFPDDPSRLVSLSTILVEFALTLSDRFRQCDLEEAAACARRATAVNDLIPATAHAGRRPRWDLLLMQAVIEDERWYGDVDRSWQEVEAALPADLKPVTDYEKDEVVSACNGLARWHLACGRHEAAAGWLARARERIEADPAVVSKRAVETGWLEARLAAAHGDHESAAAGADRILAVRTTWLAKRRAADCLHLAWRCAAMGPPAAAGAANAYRERAAWHYAEVIQALRDDVAKDPLDPWYVLPWGCASVRAAELANAAGDTARALELLSAALPKLEGVRAAAHADQWDDAVLRDGRELEQRLAAAAGH